MLLRALRPTRLGQGTPVWIDAPDFDIADHVILAPAGRSLTDDNDLLAECARRSVIPLERDRPLWRLDVIPGLPGGRIGVLLVLHHLVADGLRGVALVASLLDPLAQAQADHAAWRPQPAPTDFELVQDNARRRSVSQTPPNASASSGKPPPKARPAQIRA
jgi:diacylglycerol O-acyltransferase